MSAKELKKRGFKFFKLLVRKCCPTEHSVRYARVEHQSFSSGYNRLPGTFCSIWINREGIRTLFRFMNTLVQVCGEHAVSCRFCALNNAVFLNIRFTGSICSETMKLFTVE